MHIRQADDASAPRANSCCSSKTLGRSALSHNSSGVNRRRSTLRQGSFAPVRPTTDQEGGILSSPPLSAGSASLNSRHCRHALYALARSSLGPSRNECPLRRCRDRSFHSLRPISNAGLGSPKRAASAPLAPRSTRSRRMAVRGISCSLRGKRLSSSRTWVQARSLYVSRFCCSLPNCCNRRKADARRPSRRGIVKASSVSSLARTWRCCRRS